MTIANLLKVLQPHSASNAPIEIGQWDSTEGEPQVPAEIDHVTIQMDSDGALTKIVLEP